MSSSPQPKTFGYLADFRSPEAIVHAATTARDAGYTVMDAYTPFPIHGLDLAVGFKNSRLPWLVLIAGIVGGLTGFGMQYFASVIHYPMNIGGKPLNSWPAFIPITFEVTILFAALAAVLGMLALNGLPQPYHPVFNCPEFDRASVDRFFLSIEATDPKFSPEETRAFLESLEPLGVYEVQN